MTVLDILTTIDTELEKLHRPNNIGFTSYVYHVAKIEALEEIRGAIEAGLRTTDRDGREL